MSPRKSANRSCQPMKFEMKFFLARGWTSRRRRQTLLELIIIFIATKLLLIYENNLRLVWSALKSFDVNCLDAGHLASRSKEDVTNRPVPNVLPREKRSSLCRDSPRLIVLSRLRWPLTRLQPRVFKRSRVCEGETFLLRLLLSQGSCTRLQPSAGQDDPLCSPEGPRMISHSSRLPAAPPLIFDSSIEEAAFSLRRGFCTGFNCTENA